MDGMLWAAVAVLPDGDIENLNYSSGYRLYALNTSGVGEPLTIEDLEGLTPARNGSTPTDGTWFRTTRWRCPRRR